jgi:hypothetical protein
MPETFYQPELDPARYGRRVHPRLGRHPSVPDERNFRATRPPREQVGVDWRYYWHNGIWIDQIGPSCVGASASEMAEDGPKPLPGQGAHYLDLYRLAQDNDEWAGSNYEGSSCLGGCKALLIKGHIKAYFAVPDVETAEDWLLSGKGNIWVGTDWYNDMFDPVEQRVEGMPEAKPLLEIGGSLQGGHAYKYDAFTRNQATNHGGLWRMKNTWGRGWARNGVAFATGDTVRELHSRQGEMFSVVK